MKLTKHDELMKATAEAVMDNEHMREAVADGVCDALNYLETAFEEGRHPSSSIKLAVAKLKTVLEIVDD